MAKTRFFQQITLACVAPEASRAELAVLLGQSDKPFSLRNVDIEITAAETGQSETSVASLSLHSPALGQVSDSRGLDLRMATSPPEVVTAVEDEAAPGITAVDHVVLMSNDADDCIRLFRDELGMRLALDQSVPEWGGRMLFFREGSMTLEVIHKTEQPPAQDHFWGISFSCQNMEATHRQLASRGVKLSDIRPGRKPGTSVATIKSHCAGLPSLLLGPSVKNGNKS